MKPSNPTLISDRRAHDRHPLRTDIVLVAGGQRFAGRMMDIGKGGAAVVVDINPASGTVFAMHARLPVRPTGGEAFEVQAKVASCVLATGDGGFRIGLQFISMDAKAADVLKRCLP